MTRAGRTQSTSKTPTRGRRLFVKIVAWTLAVPALCAAVVVGGAVPLYLLLPAAEPVAHRVVEVAQTSARTLPQPLPVAERAVAEPAQATVYPDSEAVDETTTGATVADAVPDENGADALDETVAATVVPTPRPAVPKPYTQPSAAADAREVAAVGAAPLKQVSAPPAKAQPKAARSPEAALRGRRTIIRAAAKLRAAPQGAEIGVLRAGTDVVVGRCERWCEVSADGRRGFVHASLIDDGTKRRADRPGGRRIEKHPAEARRASEGRRGGERRIDQRPRYGGPAYERRDAERRFYERAYRRNEDPDWLLEERDLPPEEPDWYVEDEGPIVRGGPPALLYYEPYP